MHKGVTLSSVSTVMLVEFVAQPHCLYLFCTEAIKYVYTNIFLVDFSLLIKWTSLFPVLGVSGALFHFIVFLIEIPVSKQYRP